MLRSLRSKSEPSLSDAQKVQAASQSKEEAYRRAKATTFSLISLTSCLEKADEQILPATYNVLGRAFSASPSALGTIALSRAIVQALSSPLSGIAGHYCNRILVCAAGCVVWGLCTACFSLCTTLHAGIFFWGLNGLGLALVIPSGQSLAADYHSSTERGRAFGVMHLTGALGGMVGSLLATNLGSQVVQGVEGWRLVFLGVAAVSLGTGLLVLRHGTDPTHGSPHRAQARLSLPEVRDHLLSVLRIRSFAIIVLQGIVGNVPWTALVFLTLWLQLQGMSNFAASTLMALFLGSTAVGGLLGGLIGDKAAARYPNHGRIFVCQFSVLSGIPFSILLLKGLPGDGGAHSCALYALVLCTMGALKSWPAPACNNPIMGEIVREDLRSLVYAFDRCFEGAIASCAAPLVGWLAEAAFGFSGLATATGNPAEDLPKARALGSSLLLFLVVPWSICLVFYSGLHFTYKHDRRAAAPLEHPRPSSSLGRAGARVSPAGLAPRVSLPAERVPLKQELPSAA